MFYVSVGLGAYAYPHRVVPTSESLSRKPLPVHSAARQEVLLLTWCFLALMIILLEGETLGC